ncbi:hypothetical protein ID866_6696 [Astraeus odoratus]|nr:hypothetical protein ID866_6696 [Astraeus odoratus]
MSGQDDEDEVMVPGFSYGASSGLGGFAGAGTGMGGGGGAAGKWWGSEADGMGLNSNMGGNLPFGPSPDSRMPFGGDDAIISDDFIPGLGAADHLNTAAPPAPAPAPPSVPLGPRHGGSLPHQEDPWSGGGSGGGGGGGGGSRGDDSTWGGRRSGYYDRRGGPRRGRH